MSEQKYTSGPWEIDEGHTTKSYVTSKNGKICSCFVINGHQHMPYFDNARLIAAAFKLLEALEPFAEYIKHPTQPIHAVIRRKEWDNVIKAVDKAKGLI